MDAKKTPSSGKSAQACCPVGVKFVCMTLLLGGGFVLGNTSPRVVVPLWHALLHGPSAQPTTVPTERTSPPTTVQLDLVERQLRDLLAETRADLAVKERTLFLLKQEGAMPERLATATTGQEKLAARVSEIEGRLAETLEVRAQLRGVTPVGHDGTDEILRRARATVERAKLDAN